MKEFEKHINNLWKNIYRLENKMLVEKNKGYNVKTLSDKDAYILSILYLINCKIDRLDSKLGQFELYGIKRKY